MILVRLPVLVSMSHHQFELKHMIILTAWTAAGSRSHVLYISSTYCVLLPLRNGSAAAELEYFSDEAAKSWFVN